MSTTTDIPALTYGERFVKKLTEIEKDKGKMASLRRGLSPATQRHAWPVIASLGMDIKNGAAIATAGLFATHPKLAQARSFGQTCRLIATESGQSADIPESFDKRFRRLIASNTQDEVAGQLSAWIRLAKTKGVGVDYAKLYDDLSWWDRQADQKRVRWARDFWAPRRESDETTNPETPAA